jgi:hypothetical protein
VEESYLIQALSGDDISYPFVNLPPRKLVDYYHTISRPVSLRGVEKRIKGVHGRNAPTGVSDFKTWRSFEDELSYIWRNAREYNVEGSEIFIMAGQLEVFGFVLKCIVLAGKANNVAALLQSPSS